MTEKQRWAEKRGYRKIQLTGLGGCCGSHLCIPATSVFRPPLYSGHICEVASLSRAATADANLSSDFTVEELEEAAIRKLKSGKAPGRDNIHPQFAIHQSAKTTAWLCSFFTSCYRRSKLPNTWRRATVVALPKPNKPVQDPKSYRPISLLGVPFKILERLIHSRIDPVVDPQLPQEQAGFRRGRSTVDQVGEGGHNRTVKV